MVNNGELTESGLWCSTANRDGVKATKVQILYSPPLMEVE